MSRRAISVEPERALRSTHCRIHVATNAIRRDRAPPGRSNQLGSIATALRASSSASLAASGITVSRGTTIPYVGHSQADIRRSKSEIDLRRPTKIITCRSFSAAVPFDRCQRPR